MKDIPIYDKTVSYAIEHNELETYRASYKMNMACKAAISGAISRAYTDNSLNSQNALKELTETFSLERIAVITAVSIREQDHDGRISVQNKEWAKAFRFRKILTIGAETEMRLSELAPCIPDFWIYLRMR